jgi:hypothetical protein
MIAAAVAAQSPAAPPLKLLCTGVQHPAGQQRTGGTRLGPDGKIATGAILRPSVGDEAVTLYALLDGSELTLEDARTGRRFEVKKLEVTPSEITGRVKLAFMSRRDLRIDRQTGKLTVSARAGHVLEADCDRAPPPPAQPRF